MQCVSDVAVTVNATVVDTSGGLDVMSVTLLDVDGVDDGIEYACSVRLEVNSTTSAWSYPTFVTTPPQLGTV